MAVTITNLSHDTGEVYDALTNGTTAATSLLGVAEDYISSITGTTTGYDVAVRFFADSLVVQQVLGGVDPVSKTVGGLSIGAKELRAMRDYFKSLAEMNLKVKGFSISGLAVRAEMVNA